MPPQAETKETCLLEAFSPDGMILIKVAASSAGDSICDLHIHLSDFTTRSSDTQKPRPHQKSIQKLNFALHASFRGTNLAGGEMSTDFAQKKLSTQSYAVSQPLEQLFHVLIVHSGSTLLRPCQKLLHESRDLASMEKGLVCLEGIQLLHHLKE